MITMRRFACFTTLFFLVASMASATETPELFGAPTKLQQAAAQDLGAHAASWAVAQREVSVVTEGLKARVVTMNFPEGPVLALRTMQGDHFDAVGRKIGSVTRWKLEGATASSTITCLSDLCAGRIFTSDRMYLLLPGIGGTESLLRLDAAAVARIHRSLVHDVVRLPVRHWAARPHDSGAIPQRLLDALASASASGVYQAIDVESYTSTLAAQVGAGPLVTVIYNTIDEDNTILVDNGTTNGQIKLVAVTEWSYSETGNTSTDIANLEASSFIEAFRAQHHAIFVGLWVLNGGSGATEPESPPGFGEFQYSVVTYLEATVTGWVDAHEKGHNLALNHNPEDAPPNSYWPYSYGWWSQAVQTVDIMSSAAPCNGCSTALLYSNENGMWKGVVTGSPAQNAVAVIAIAFAGYQQYFPNASACTPGATALCLLNSRFRVESTWQTNQGSGQGQAVTLTSDTGYFWFFAEANVEFILKVLDGTPLNQHFWVFAGGLTNVKVVITVTDTQTGAMKTYTNPQDTAFQPIQDTGAFPQ
ncbi:MAG TPA: hypothetical protein VHR45_00760 [Thermoanaerobaculia bacterium]|nr:hypothetical protein [Thermoanaerobaculia bacterium]